MAREIYIICSYCERQFIAKRHSAMYCTKSCKSMACRARRKAEIITEIKQAEENVQIKQAWIRLEQMEADSERFFADLYEKDRQFKKENDELKRSKRKIVKRYKWK